MKLLNSPARVFFLYLIAGFLLYAPALNAPFVFDDYDLILANPLARHWPVLLNGWRDAGLKFITYLTFAFNFSVGQENPLGYHVINILLHVTNAWLLYFLSRQILRTPQIFPQFSEQQKATMPFAAAIVFLVHPVATSAVNYVWQRSELLTAFFYLSSLIFYVRARTAGKKLYFIAAGLCFVIGLFAKGTIVFLPLMVVLFECALWPVSRRKGYAIILSIGSFFFLKAYLYLWEEPWAIHTQFITLPLMQWTGTILSPEYFWTQFYVTVKYLGLVFFPWPQSFDYDIPVAVTFWEPRIYFSALLLAGVIVLALWFWNKRRLVSLGIFWFLLCLMPAALMGGREPMWEYRMYGPLAGMALGLMALLVQSVRPQNAVKIVFLLCTLFFGLALARNFFWQNPERLLLDTIRQFPRKPHPYQLLGAYYLTQGRAEEAERYLEKTIALAPDAAESYNNLGLIFKNRGETQKAQALFDTAVRLRPTLTGAYVNLAYLLLNDGEDQKAEEILRQGLRFGETEGIFACLGKVYLSRGRLTEAESFLQKSLEINPRASSAYFWYGELSVARREKRKARDMFHKALEINPRLINLVPLEYR